jgi:hypothetical protein
VFLSLPQDRVIERPRFRLKQEKILNEKSRRLLPLPQDRAKGEQELVSYTPPLIDVFSDRRLLPLPQDRAKGEKEFVYKVVEVEVEKKVMCS